MPDKIPMEEQETTINLVPARISRKAEVYSCIPDTMKRLRKFAGDRPEAVRIIKDDGLSVTAELDRSWIRIAPKRQVSEEQRKAMADRLAASRAKKEASP